MGFGDFVKTAGGGLIASTGLGILADAFGGDSGPSLGKQYRENIKYAGAHLPNYVANAKAAGLHPLFAMGASGGGSPQFAIPGQTREGSFASRGLKTASAAMGKYAQINAQKELVEAQNQAAALRIAEGRLSNDTATGATDVILSKVPHRQAAKMSPLAEYKPAEIGSHVKGKKTETGSVRSVMTGIRIGDQVIQFPIEEPDQLVEDPATALMGAYLYGGNRHVDWGKAARQYMDIREPYKYKNRAESTTRKKILFGLATIARHWKRTRGQGR